MYGRQRKFYNGQPESRYRIAATTSRGAPPVFQIFGTPNRYMHELGMRTPRAILVHDSTIRHDHFVSGLLGRTVVMRATCMIDDRF